MNPIASIAVVVIAGFLLIGGTVAAALGVRPGEQRMVRVKFEQPSAPADPSAEPIFPGLPAN